MNWWKETNLFPPTGLNGNQNGQYPGQRPGDIPEWEARFEYDAGEEVYNSGNYYRCAESHIASQVFATDLAAGKWVIFAGPDVTTAGEMAFAASDQTTPLIVASNIAGIFAEFDMTLESLFAGVGVLGTTSGGTRIQIQKNGVDMLSTPITIDHGDTTSLTATTPPVISVSSITRGDRISVDIQDISGGATEAGLQIVLNGIRA